MRKGQPFFARFVSGLRKPRRPTTPGSELAGEVTADGPGVSRFAVGDRVVGSTGAGLGASAEYALLEQAGALARIPGMRATRTRSSSVRAASPRSRSCATPAGSRRVSGC